MLYLIKSENYLKIGYTNNLKERLKSYYTANPDIQLLHTIEGDRIDEDYLHNLFNDYHYKLEWFYYNQEIIDKFKSYIRPDSLNVEEVNIPTPKLDRRLRCSFKKLLKAMQSFTPNNLIFEKDFLFTFQCSLYNLKEEQLDKWLYKSIIDDKVYYDFSPIINSL